MLTPDRRAVANAAVRRTSWLAVVLLLALPVSGGSAAVPAAAPKRPVAAAATPAAATCPAGYAQPRPDRPRVHLRFVLTSGKSSFAGYERIVFRPDRRTQRIVLRQWVNMPKYRAAGAHGRVRKVTVTGATSTTYRPADNGATLVTVPLPTKLQPGQTVTIVISFSVRLPTRSGNRVGTTGTTAWWGSGHPMLAWEQGVGWATDPPGTLWGERTTSEDVNLARLSIVTKAGDTVGATGRRTKVLTLTGGRREHFFAAPSVRDVMVVVGPMRSTARTVGATRLRVVAARGVPDSILAVANTMERAMVAHAGRFGPFPYSHLTVAVLPRIDGGIEFPGGIMLGSGQYRDSTASHEVAHEWFYGLVGNNQGRDPWLDESFATYAEALHRGTGSTYRSMTIPSDGQRRVGAPMTYWERHQSSYWRSVYVQGAAALLRARSKVGASAFDRAIRCYVRSRAHRVSRPGFLARALEGLPAARAVLVHYGALPTRYAP